MVMAMLAIPCILLMYVTVVALLVWDGRRAAVGWKEFQRQEFAGGIPITGLPGTSPVPGVWGELVIVSPEIRHPHDYLHSDEIAVTYD